MTSMQLIIVMSMIMLRLPEQVVDINESTDLMKAQFKSFYNLANECSSETNTMNLNYSTMEISVD